MIRALGAVVLLACLCAPAGAQRQEAPDPVAALLGRLEQVLRGGQPERYLDLLAASADRASCAAFAKTVVVDGITRAAARERDRIELPGTLPGDGYRLMVDVMLESGAEAKVSTWRLDVRRRGGGTVGDWGIVSQQVMTTLQGLHHLALNPAREVAVKDLDVRAEDLRLVVPEGVMFVAEIEGWPTALVILGRGEMTFSPAPAAERGQMTVLTGNEVFQTPFDAIFVRVNPNDAQAHVVARVMDERPVDARDFKRADDVFHQEVVKSFGLDLGDLSPDAWSLLPLPGDFLAEIRTRRYDTLTYARSTDEIEDISLYDRKKRRNISVYSSKAHLERYTPFYNEDEQAEYRVLSYGVDVGFTPSAHWLAGQTSLNIEVAARSINTLTLRLADSLAVRSVVSAEFGRMLCIRVRQRDSIVVDLPQTLTRGSRLHLLVSYAGRLDPQPVDREAVEPQFPDVRRNPNEEQVEVPLEESFLYSNRSYWYAQPGTTGYATARIAITVPEPWSVLASGEQISTAPVPAPAPGGASLMQFSFRVNEPVRYLACVVTRMSPPRTETVSLKGAEESARRTHVPGVHHEEVEVTVRTNRRQQRRGPEIQRAAASIIRFYTSLVGDFPYDSLSVATVERPLPGGHSPGYMVVVAVPGPGLPVRWADDPGVLPDFPDFFLAHELAHQWWGQAVGWKNYHEQWLSEGFAQYFAALYAERSRGQATFDAIVRRMHDWATEASDQGPISLGYRVGHVKGDSRVFRAVVYDKGAMVLHMLRRLMGDDAFFGGLRRFYDDWRFKKAGTDDLRHALEAESGLDLTRFFDRWVLGSGLPQVTVSSRVETGDGGQEAVVEFDQVGDVYDVPVTLAIESGSKSVVTTLVKLTERHTVVRVPFKGDLRRVDVNRDDAALGTFTPRPSSSSSRVIIRESWTPSM
jgi:hypothetical protein